MQAAISWNGCNTRENKHIPGKLSQSSLPFPWGTATTAPDRSQSKVRYLQVLKFCVWHQLWLRSSSSTLAHTEVFTPAAGDPHPGEQRCSIMGLAWCHQGVMWITRWERAWNSCSSSSRGTQWLWPGSANVHLIMRHTASF